MTLLIATVRCWETLSLPTSLRQRLPRIPKRRNSSKPRFRAQFLSTLPAAENVFRPRPLPMSRNRRLVHQLATVRDMARTVHKSQKARRENKQRNFVLWCYGPPGVGKSVLASIAPRTLSSAKLETRPTYAYVTFSRLPKLRPANQGCSVVGALPVVY